MSTTPSDPQQPDESRSWDPFAPPAPDSAQSAQPAGGAQNPPQYSPYSNPTPPPPPQPQFPQDAPPTGAPAGAQQSYGQQQYGQQQYGQQQYERPYGQYNQYPPPPPPPAPGEYGQSAYGAYPGSSPAGMPAYAGWWRRVGAWLLDNAVVGAIFGIIADAANSSAIETIGGVVAVLWAIYNAYLAGKTGQSYGKRAAGIRLARLADGMPVGVGYGLLRWLLDQVFVWLCVIPGLLNYLWPVWDRQSQTWCDKIAKSVVVVAQ